MAVPWVASKVERMAGTKDAERVAQLEFRLVAVSGYLSVARTGCCLAGHWVDSKAAERAKNSADQLVAWSASCLVETSADVTVAE